MLKEFNEMKLRIFLFASILTVSLAACNQNNLPNNEVGNESTNDQNRTEIDVEQSSYEQNNQYSNNEIATHLANIAADVPDVNDAVAIIAGPYAVVGIDIDEETDREQVGTIKYAVSEALKNDPYGKTAVVIADADMMQRLREMNTKMRQGHPVQGVTEELAEIVGRYMPTFPVDENRPEEPSDNEHRIDEHHDQEEIRDIRKEQSNQDEPEQQNLNREKEND